MLFLLIFCSTIVIPILFVVHIALKPIKQKLRGKVVLVTGGASGLGQQMCIKLAQKGCNIVIVDSSSSDETLRKLKSYQVKAKGYQVNVSNQQEILLLKEGVKSDFGAVDILVNNFEMISNKKMVQQSSEDIDKLTQVSINSVIFMTKCFIDKMIEKGHGQIVSISSLQGISDRIRKSTTNYAITGFMLGLKDYLKKEKLDSIKTMCCVIPDIVATKHELAKNQFRYPMMKPDESTKVIIDGKLEQCAKIIVEGIINNKSFLSVPRSYSINAILSNIWVRNHVKHDYTFFKKMIQ